MLFSPQFQNLVARSARSTIDEKTVRHRNFYKKIEEKEKKREQEQTKGKPAIPISAAGWHHPAQRRLHRPGPKKVRCRRLSEL